MTTTLTKSLKLIVVVAVALLSTACAQNSSYGVADYSYHNVTTGGYIASGPQQPGNVFSEF